MWKCECVRVQLCRVYVCVGSHMGSRVPVCPCAGEHKDVLFLGKAHVKLKTRNTTTSLEKLNVISSEGMCVVRRACVQMRERRRHTCARRGRRRAQRQCERCGAVACAHAAAKADARCWCAPHAVGAPDHVGRHAWAHRGRTGGLEESAAGGGEAGWCHRACTARPVDAHGTSLATR